MTVHQNISRRSTKPRRALGVQALLEWAFRIEKAQLDLPAPPDEVSEGHGFGLEYVLLQRAQLGCRVDGGRYKPEASTHEDAETIAAIVAGLPDNIGGRRMAIRIAELARGGMTPDWMPGAIPRCVPVETRRNQHGERSATVVVGTERVLNRGRWRMVDVLTCTVTWSPHPDQIAAARRAYTEWWRALGWIRDGLATSGLLREIDVAEVMPKVEPWR